MIDTGLCIPPPRQYRAVAHKLYLWGQDRDAAPYWRTVSVQCMDGHPNLHAELKRIIGEGWNRASRLRFVFVDGPGEVRVTFAPGASWSYVGTYCLGVPSDQPTMQLGWFATSGEGERQRVALHEFGHALGLEHEHMHPGVAIPWNRDAVYAYFRRTNGWDREMVDGQVLTPLAAEVAQTGTYDPGSVMHYSIPAELLTDPGWAVIQSGHLSEHDKEFAASVYGPPIENKNDHLTYLGPVMGD